MKKINLIISVLVIIFLCSVYNVIANEYSSVAPVDIEQELESMGFEVPSQPQVAPAFDITDLDGNVVKLDDFNEPLVILNFWVDWCPDSQAEKPKLQQFYTQMQNENYKLFTIHHKGTIDQVKEFMQSNGYSMHTGVDFDATGAFEPYGATKYPTNFVIDNNRNIIGSIDDSVRIAWDTTTVQEKFRNIIEALSNEPEPPVLNFTADELEINEGESTTLRWNAQNADILTASGAWSGEQSTSGDYDTGPLNSATEFILTAEGTGGEITKNLTIKVVNGNILENGKEVTSSLAGTGEEEVWQINVEKGTSLIRTVLKCEIGDFDVYGKLGSVPTTSDYDWRGYTNGDEDVAFNNPGGGTWYMMIKSYNGSGEYKLNCSLITDNSNVLVDGVPADSSLSAVNEIEIWKIDVAGNPNTMRTVLECDGGDFDVYGKFGSEPTASNYDWCGYTYGGEDVTHYNPVEGSWYLMVRSYEGSGQYTIKCSLKQ